ncbi:MAG TPA: deoxyribonuclease IV [Myxococcaceae bacterium]|nr:deoxyribonuclease IV [Myxococcaceae bacterium]
MKLGAHESVAGGVSRAFGRAADHGARSLQIFTRSARGWSSPPLTAQERRAFRREARGAGVPVIAHGSYLVNLASEDPVIRSRSLEAVREELLRCEALGIRSLVFHPGSHPTLRRGLRLVARALDEVHRALPGLSARICLEVTAGQGNCLGHRLEDLEEILARVDAPGRVGVCLDTCHLFSAGYDLSTEAGTEAVTDEAVRRFGRRRIRCFHLNDSLRPRGARVDRHAEIGRGAMGLPAFRFLVNDARFAATPAVLETPDPGRYARGLRLLHSLIRK